jgi:ribonuclease HIII
VRDSKALSDETALKIAKKLKENFPYKVLVLVPETYNRLYAQFRNLNRLLAWGHYTVLQELHQKTSCKKAILDQFADEKLVQSFLNKHHLEVDLIQRVRAEEDPVVAAASILARAAFLEGLDALSKKFAIVLPKGASSLVITAGKKAVIKHGPEVLSLLAKTHFKTTQAICDA